MKKTFNLILLASVLIFSACNTTKNTATTEATKTSKELVKPNPDMAGAITFAAENERYSANGTFKKWKFTKVDMNGNDLESLNANIEIDLTSIWEKSDKLTEHLKAWDYFDVEKYQKAMLAVNNIRSKGDGTYMAEMQLSMRDKTQRIQSIFELMDKKTMRIKGIAEVDRSLFGIGTDNTSVPNMIKVTYDVAIPQ